MAKKYCPALVVMLYSELGYSHKTICEITGYSSSGVGNIISRKIGTRKKRGHVVRAKWSRYQLDQSIIKDIEIEYIAGASSYELGEKYDVNHATINKWMRELGHKRGKGYCSQAGKAGIASNKKKQEAAARKLIERFKGKLSLVEYGRTTCTFKCDACGCVFSRSKPKYNENVCCPDCRTEESRKRKEAREEAKIQHQAEYKASLKVEYEKEKICLECGSVFHSQFDTAKYCSRKCQRKANRKRQGNRYNCGNHRKRARAYGVPYEPGISLERLIERDGLTCAICGGVCNPNDKNNGRIGLTYPTIDHIIAMKNGGGHTWDNVQVAHMICNSTKRDLLEEELTEEVIAHAKEQTIANKCA